MRRLGAMLRGACPRCMRGAVWRSLLSMHERCPVCELVYEREPGYFTGAMVVSYAMGVGAFGIITIGLLLLGLDAVAALLVGGAAYLLLAPFIMRASRVIWLHFDWLLDPEP